MTIKTAICKDSRGNIIPVHCKLWTNGQTTSLKNTKDQLAKDHPDLTFVNWVKDLNDTQSLNLYFLSPNVMARTIWVELNGAFQQVRLNRDLTIETI